MRLHLTQVASPHGEVQLVTDACGVVWLLTLGSSSAGLLQDLCDRYGDVVLIDDQTAPARAIGEKIARYFKGDFSALEGIPIVVHGSALRERLSAALHENADCRAPADERARIEQARCFVG